MTCTPTVTDKIPSLEELKHCSVTQLRILFEQLLEISPPRRASPDFLRGNIAWHLQALKINKDPVALREYLACKAGKNIPSTKPAYKTGARLVREWQGQTFEVTILEKGYRWRNQTYRSLSQIAREITGSHWSGPRFFGLK